MKSVWQPAWPLSADFCKVLTVQAVMASPAPDGFDRLDHSRSDATDHSLLKTKALFKTSSPLHELPYALG